MVHAKVGTSLGQHEGMMRHTCKCELTTIESTLLNLSVAVGCCYYIIHDVRLWVIAIFTNITKLYIPTHKSSNIFIRFCALWFMFAQFEGNKLLFIHTSCAT